MRALYGTAANVKGRTNNLIHSQRLGTDGGADDIDHCIDRTDFMEVNALDGCIVNLCLGSSQVFKNVDGSFLCDARNRSG